MRQPPIGGRRDEAGIAVVWAITAIGLLVTVMLVCVQAAALFVAHRQAQASADLGALAGALALRDGEDPCSAAGSVAVRNHGHVTTCTVRTHLVAVEVEIERDGLFGVWLRARARAVAGPSGGLGESGWT